MIRHQRFFHQLTAQAKKYFFVDTNVIVGYRENQYDDRLPAFIENPRNHFFYTETVLDELNKAAKDYPEKFPEKQASSKKRFHFIKSGITSQHKETTISLLHDLWVKKFSDRKLATQAKFGLSERQLEKFQKDLFIIFEAGFACYAPGVLPENDLREPPLITNNMPLFKKFISEKETQAVLEDAINLSGLEHLIAVEPLEEILNHSHEPHLSSRLKK